MDNMQNREKNNINNKLKKAAALITAVTMVFTAVFWLSACDAGEVLKQESAGWEGYRKESFYLNTLCDITIYRIDYEKAASRSLGKTSQISGKSSQASDKSTQTDDKTPKNPGSNPQISVEIPQTLCKSSQPHDKLKLSEEELKREYDDIISDCFKLISDYERLFSKTVDGSDIDKINKSGGIPIKVDMETVEVIKKGIEFGELSGGLFDITIGKASELWNFTGDDEGIDSVNNGTEPADSDTELNESAGSEDESGNTDAKPSDEALNEAIRHIDYRKISVDGETGYIKLKDPEMEIDLGGIAKGYIADRAANFLRERGVISGIVNLGGNIVAIGGKALSESYEEAPDENLADFNLGIINPLSENGELLGFIPARDVTIVTSGTYERYVEKDGVSYHHILDPKTGFPVDTELVQVSVIAEAGRSVDCDGLSTACLALGADGGTALIDKLNASEKYGRIEAIFLDRSGNVSFTNPDTAFTLSRKN